MKLIFWSLLLSVVASCSGVKVKQKVYVVERERESIVSFDHNGEEERISNLGNLNHATIKFKNGFGYVLARDGFISKFDIDTNKLIHKVKIGKSGIGLTFIQDYIAIVNYDPNSVVILDQNLNVLKVVETKSRNVGVKVFNQFLVFSLMDTNQIWVLDSSKDFATVKVIESAGNMPFDALIKDNLYIVGFFHGGDVGLLNLNNFNYHRLRISDAQEKTVLKVPHFGYWGIIGNQAIIPMVSANKLLVVDLLTLQTKQEITLPGNPVFAIVSPNKEWMAVNFSGDYEDNISIIDLKTLKPVKDLSIGRRVMHLRFSLDGKSLYASTYFDHKLHTLSTKDWSVLKQETVANPSGIFIPETSEMAHEK